MEKISLYDLLSILLPGALLTLAIEVILIDNNIEIDSLELNEYFKLTIFLSSSIFLGSLINILTRELLTTYKRIGLYTPLHKVYKQCESLNPIKPFYSKLIKSFDFKIKNENKKKEEELEHLWSIIYYELEAKQQISAPKNFQSFYFFFRNFFTLGLILLIPFIIQTCLHWPSEKYIALLSLNILGMLLSIPAGNWNRIQMAQRMFWTYYSLNKDKKL